MNDIKTWPRWLILWAAWVLATSIGRTVGSSLGSALIQDPDVPIIGLFVDLLMSAFLIGIGQWLILSRCTSVSVSWSVATILGWIVGQPVGFMLMWLTNAVITLAVGETNAYHFFYRNSEYFAALAAVGAGAIFGLAQWVAIRRVMKKTGWWIPASALGWTFGSAAAGWAVLQTRDGDVENVIQKVALLITGSRIGRDAEWTIRNSVFGAWFGSMEGAIAGAVTGFVLVLLLMQGDNAAHALQASTATTST